MNVAPALTLTQLFEQFKAQVLLPGFETAMAPEEMARAIFFSGAHAMLAALAESRSRDQQLRLMKELDSFRDEVNHILIAMQMQATTARPS